MIISALIQAEEAGDKLSEDELRAMVFLLLIAGHELGADIIGTAVAPSWNQVGKLGAIAVIRTGLNYFLARETKEQQEAVAKRENVAMEASEP